MTALCLDLGTTTGWAVRKDGIVQSGVATFKSGRYEGGGMRFLKFSRWLESMVVVSGATSVFFEEVRRHSAVDAAHVYGGLLATMSAFCEERQLPYLGIPVGTIKKSATDKGNANKEAMIAAVKAQGFNPADDNEADAIALLQYLERETY